MLLTFDKWNKQFGTRRKDQVLNPQINDINSFVLPRNSHLHYVNFDGGVGISANDPLIKNYESGKVICKLISSYLNTDAGGFKTVTITLTDEIRKYFKENRTLYNFDRNVSHSMIDKNLVVTNYSLMEAGITYFNSNLAWWLQYQNRYRSVFDNIKQSMEKDKRDHYVVIDVPDLFPSIPQFQLFEKDPNNTSAIKKIANSERMNVAQIWNWVAQENKSIIFEDSRFVSRLNFIMRHYDQWISVNGQFFLSLKKSVSNKGTWNQLQAQKNLMAFMLSMSLGTIEDIATDDVPDEKVPDSVVKHGFEQKDDTLNVNDFTKQAIKNVDKILDKVEEQGDDTDIKNEEKVDRLLNNLEEVNIDVVDNAEAGDVVDQKIIVKDKMLENNAVPLIDYKEYMPPQFNDPTTDHETIFKEKLKQAVLKGVVTPQQMKRFEKLSQRYKEIPNPLGGGGSLADAARISSEDLKISKDDKFIDEINMVTDQSFLKSTLKSFDSKYVENVLNKDIFNKVLSIQKHGIAVQNYQITRVSKLGDEYDVHSVKLVPIEGEPSTITFKIPVIDESGVYQSRAVKNRMRKQRGDVVIRKIDSDVVSLTSDVSKMFVERSKFVAYSSDTWLRNQFINTQNKDIQIKWGATKTIEEFDKNFEKKHGKKAKAEQIALLKRVPRIYSQIASYIKEISYKGRIFYFDITKLDEHFGEEVAKEFEKSRDVQVLVGKGKNSLIVLNNDGKLLEFRIDKDEHVELGTLEAFLDFEVDKKPIDCAELVMSTKEIPIGVLLGFYLGLGNLMKTLKVNNYFVVKGGKKPEVRAEREVVIQFGDGTLYVDVTNNYKAELILGGFNRYKKFIKNFSMYEFDKKNVYSVVFSNAGLPGRFVREFSILRDMWVDPVSFELLREMNEPTDFVLLLIRAVELIEFDYHPAEMDRGLMRDRGYERITTFVYDEMIKSIRTHNSNPIKQNAKISMNPEAVWMRIISDETNSPIEESNPLHNIKESEVVVFRGSGGRSSRTMNSNSRAFTRNAIGVDSECTVDNGDAGTIRFLTANPNYNSLRGTVDRLEDFDANNNSTCLHTSLLLNACGEYDDF